MALKASYANESLGHIVTGYRISCLYSPSKGFEGNFYVYLYLKNKSARQPLPPVSLRSAAADLLFEGEQENEGPQHNFPKIHFQSAETWITRRERIRILEFKYDEEILKDSGTNIELVNTSTKDVETQGDLTGAYDMTLAGGTPVHLLAFSARQTPLQSNSLRFVRYATYRDKSDDCAWLRKIVNGRFSFRDFQVHLGDQPPIQVAKSNVARIHIDESYGDMLSIEQPSLADLISEGASARLNLHSHSPSELIDHRRGQQTGGADATDAIESTTVVFEHPSQVDNKFI